MIKVFQARSGFRMEINTHSRKAETYVLFFQAMKDLTFQ